MDSPLIFSSFNSIGENESELNEYLNEEWNQSEWTQHNSILNQQDSRKRKNHSLNICENVIENDFGFRDEEWRREFNETAVREMKWDKKEWQVFVELSLEFLSARVEGRNQFSFVERQQAELSSGGIFAYFYQGDF
eukprot:TRINITY_DN13066_c0_g1_i1.p1 TRINITY_DN13066_c0_g1~~TRINITY_DN13066_c0_g1_i1.p1  ORF type:complete len:136 (+),score=48.60 TRINITY_DN13066_c0_g1_i1:79-486(+)